MRNADFGDNETASNEQMDAVGGESSSESDFEEELTNSGKEDRLMAVGDTETVSDQTRESISSPGTEGRVVPTQRRNIEVSPELFRIVVVFSTLIAIGAVLVGFILLDTATRVIDNPHGALPVELLQGLLGLSNAAIDPHVSTIALGVGIAGLGAIGFGIWVYAIGTRFHVEKMGKDKDTPTESSGDG